MLCAASADQQSAAPMQAGSRSSSTGRGDRGDSVFIREYNQNKLLREDAVSAEELDAVFGPFERRQERRQKRRIRTKRVQARTLTHLTHAYLLVHVHTRVQSVAMTALVLLCRSAVVAVKYLSSLSNQLQPLQLCHMCGT